MATMTNSAAQTSVTIGISASAAKQGSPPKQRKPKAPKAKKITQAKPGKQSPLKKTVSGQVDRKTVSPRKGRALTDSKATKWILSELPKAKGHRSIDDMVQAYTDAREETKGPVNLMFIDVQTSHHHQPKAKAKKPKNSKPKSKPKDKIALELDVTSM